MVVMKALSRLDFRGFVFLLALIVVSAGIVFAPAARAQSAQPNQAATNSTAACSEQANSGSKDATDVASAKVSNGAKAVSNLGSLFGKKKTADDANKVAAEAAGCAPNANSSASGAAGAKGGPNGAAKGAPNANGAKSPEPATINTAQVAASAGFVDVVGIKLGMEPNDALAALKAANSGFTDSNIVIGYLPSKADFQQGNRDSGAIVSVAANVTSAQAGSEQVAIDFSYPPSPGYVVSVARTMTFASGQQPLADNLIAGLRKKYGAETFGQMPKGAAVAQSLTWIFDAQGKLISAGQLPNQNQTLCAATVQEPPKGQDLEDELNTLAANPQLPQQIQQYTGGTNDPCKDYTVVVATTGPQTGAGLATSLQVKVTSHPLIRGSWAGLLTYAQQSARAQAAQATPKL